MIGWFVRTSVEETPNLPAVQAAQAREKKTQPPQAEPAAAVNQSAATPARQ